MRYLQLIRQFAIVLSLGFSMSVFANQDASQDPSGPTQEELAAQAAEAEQSAALASIASDRYGTIAGIVAIWEPAMGGGTWEEEITIALNAATDGQLLDIQNASSYDVVRAILQGRDTPVSMEGVAGPEVLGDTTRDLVFSPVVPCRFFDTRNDLDPNPGHNTGPATTKSYQVYGTAFTMQNQGGSVACNAPSGESVGIHGNFTAVPFASPSTGKGNIRAWPYLGSLPNVSLVNYEAGTNIANTASVGTCYFCAFDLNVTTAFQGADSIGDVMGYYYPANVPVGADFAGGAQIVTLTPTDTVVRSVTITKPTSGTVLVTASGYFDFNDSAGIDVARCSITTGTAIDFSYLIIAGEQSATSDVNWMPFAGTRGFSVPAGSTTFRLVCDEFDGNVTVEDTNMTAIFTRNRY